MLCETLDAESLSLALSVEFTEYAIQSISIKDQSTISTSFPFYKTKKNKKNKQKYEILVSAQTLSPDTIHQSHNVLALLRFLNSSGAV